MSTHGKDAHFAVADSAGVTLRNISPYLDSIAFNQGQDTHDDTTYGNNGHTYRGGLTDGSISIGGLYDRTEIVGPNIVLQSLLGHAEPVPFEYGPEGDTAGAPRQSGVCVLESFNQSAPVADLVKFTASFKISGAVTDGVFPA